MFLIHFTPSFKLENNLADDFLHHYSIESRIHEIYELFYIIISDLTKNSPNRMMLRLGEFFNNSHLIYTFYGEEDEIKIISKTIFNTLELLLN